jgi:hypothetical protein
VAGLIYIERESCRLLPRSAGLTFAEKATNLIPHTHHLYQHVQSRNPRQPPPLPLVYYTHSSVFSLSLFWSVQCARKALTFPYMSWRKCAPFALFFPNVVCVCILWMCVSCPDKIQLFVSSLFLFFFCFVLFCFSLVWRL